MGSILDVSIATVGSLLSVDGLSKGDADINKASDVTSCGMVTRV